MSITDMIKSSVLEAFSAGGLTTTAIAMALGAAILAGLFIYLIYRLITKSGFYNRSFNRTLAVLPLITSGIMLAMQSNLVISLGMVGALSIVRFRNAVKDPSDLLFLFWSISVGIIVGAGLYELAVLLCIAAAAFIFLLDLLPSLRQPCLLVISGSDVSLEASLAAIIRKHCRRSRVRSRNITSHGAEWIFELQARNEVSLIKKLSETQGVSSVNLMTHDGDVRF